MRRHLRRGTLLCLLVLLAVLGPAAVVAAQGSTTISFGISGPGGGPVALRQLSVASSGSLSVQFRADPLSCARHGVCGYAGTIVVTPPAGSDLVLAKFRAGGHTSYDGFLGVGEDEFVNHAEVERDGHTCTDAVTGGEAGSAAPVTGGVRFSLLGAGTALLTTRCAGPLDADVASAMASRLLRGIDALRRGSRLDFTGTHSFRAGGFAGTLRSTVVMRVTAVARGQNGGGSPPPPGVHITRMRYLTETFKVLRAVGTIRASASGLADPAQCALLDSCGAKITYAWGLPGPGGTASLTAIGPARLPYRSFLVALGLRRGRRAAKIAVTGGIYWDSPATATEVFQQQASCRETAPLPFQNLFFSANGNRLELNYSQRPPRTRCPGPIASFTSSGSLPARGLAGRRPSLTLVATSSFGDDGYAGRSLLRLSVTLRRGRLTQSFFNF